MQINPMSSRVAGLVPLAALVAGLVVEAAQASNVASVAGPIQDVTSRYWVEANVAQARSAPAVVGVKRYVAPPSPATAASAPPVSTPPSDPPVVAAPALRWQVLVADMTISRTLERWSGEAGIRVRWDAARTFPISAPTTFTGSFEEAVSALLSTPGVKDSDYPLEACLYANVPPLLRVTRRGEQTSACTASQAVSMKSEPVR